MKNIIRVFLFAMFAAVAAAGILFHSIPSANAAGGIGGWDTVSDMTPQVGETITYTLNVTLSLTTTSTVSISDVLGNGLTFVSATSSAGTYSSSTGI